MSTKIGEDENEWGGISVVILKVSDPDAFIHFFFARVCVCMHCYCYCFSLSLRLLPFYHLFHRFHQKCTHIIRVYCFLFTFVDYSFVCSFVCSHLLNLVCLKADTSIWLVSRARSDVCEFKCSIRQNTAHTPRHTE